MRMSSDNVNMSGNKQLFAQSLCLEFIVIFLLLLEVVLAFVMDC